MRILFRGARLVDGNRDELGDLLVEDGLVTALGPDATSVATAGGGRGPSIVIDCSRAASGSGPLVLMPAFVDLHAHLREPGQPDKERVESGCLAAAAGGFGTLLAMANTKPVTDTPALALATKARADALGLVDYLPAIAATRGLEGRDVSHLEALRPLAERHDALAELGIRVISDDGRDAADDATFLAAMRVAAELGLVVACHCELGPAVPPPGVEALDWYASPEGRAADRAAEFRGVRRAIRLAKEAGCALHLCHLSTRESIELVRSEKRAAQDRSDGIAVRTRAAGFRLSCEATPHHLGLVAAEAVAAGAATLGRVNPWLRDEDDRAAVLAGLADGTIDAIATDHAPHSAADKEAGAPGFSGLETAFALTHDRLCADGPTVGAGFDLRRLSALLSASPARILGLRDRGYLVEGARADLVLVDPGSTWIVDSSKFRSKGANSLLDGRRLRGRVLMTLHQGRIVYDQF